MLPRVVQHKQKPSQATPLGGFASPHTFTLPVPPCSQHPAAPPIISSHRHISTKQRIITGQICSVNQLRGLHFLSVQLPPQQDLPKWMKPLLSTFGSCLEQLMEGKKNCHFTTLQKFNPLILHIITKEGDTSFDIILLNSVTVCYSECELK